MLDTVTDLKSMLNDPTLLRSQAYVDGTWVDGSKGTFDVVNPARGDVIAHVADLDRADVAKAIDGAHT
ncbi:MAG: aldehyde dehydrogenase family protein, partial [Pseudomonadota bacterium]